MATNGTFGKTNGSPTPNSSEPTPDPGRAIPNAGKFPPHTGTQDQGASFSWLCRGATLAYALLAVIAFAATLTLVQPQPLIAVESAQFFGFAALWGTWSVVVMLTLVCGIGRWLPLRRIPAVGLGVGLWFLWVAATGAVGVGAYLVGWLGEPLWIARAAGIAALFGWGLWWALAGWREEYAQRLLAQEARQAALLARTQPHFLFNSLNTIAGLLPDQPEQAEQAIAALAKLLHETLAHPQPWSLAEELAAARSYLTLVSWRYKSRLIVDWQMRGHTARLPQVIVPRWVVVPLVENAIVHSVALRREPTVVQIAVEATEHDVTVRIANPVAREATANPTPHHGLGLAIVREQLRRWGGTFRAGDEHGQFVVQWRLPLRQRGIRAQKGGVNGDLVGGR